MRSTTRFQSKTFFIVSLTIFICTVIICTITKYIHMPTHINGQIVIGPDMAAANGTQDTPITEETDSIAADTEVTLSWFGFSLKKAKTDILPNTALIPCGMTVGVTFQTDGVMVLGTGGVTDANGTLHHPGDKQLKAGDLIIAVNGEPLDNKTQLIALIESAKPSKPLTFSVKRDGTTITCAITPITNADNINKIGVWVRDGTQGIGTLTYYNPDTMKFGALGHGIMDVDTKKLLTVRTGKLMDSKIVTVKKGKKGGPGELIGEIAQDASIGRIVSNTELGLYGYMTSPPDALPQERMPIALQNEIHEGPATIRANVSGKEIKEYDVYIESVNRYSADEAKGMVIRITDQELIAKTNGIVQGMSGSPILQNGKIVGAVTHVFVQNPLKGYGIFIENMLRQERGI